MLRHKIALQHGDQGGHKRLIAGVTDDKQGAPCSNRWVAKQWTFPLSSGRRSVAKRRLCDVSGMALLSHIPYSVLPAILAARGADAR
jgi:hypothetical protein